MDVLARLELFEILCTVYFVSQSIEIVFKAAQIKPHHP